MKMTPRVTHDFVHIFTRRAYAPACANNLLHPYIHSEPTIHQPRPPERRIDRPKAIARRSFPPYERHPHLLVTQRDDGIDAHGTPRGDITGQ